MQRRPPNSPADSQSCKGAHRKETGMSCGHLSLLCTPGVFGLVYTRVPGLGDVWDVFSPYTVPAGSWERQWSLHERKENLGDIRTLVVKNIPVPSMSYHDSTKQRKMLTVGEQLVRCWETLHKSSQLPCTSEIILGYAYF